MQLRNWVVWIVLMCVPIWGSAAIVDKLVLNNVIYLLDDTNKKIFRYDLSSAAFLTPITITGTETPYVFDSINGTDFYIGMGRDIRKYTINNDDSVTQSAFRRFSGKVQAIHINGDFLVASYGNDEGTSANSDIGVRGFSSTGGELLSLRLSDGVTISRAPDYGATITEDNTSSRFPLVMQMQYFSTEGKYFLRLKGDLAPIFVDFNSVTGMLTNFNEGSQDFEKASAESERLFLIPELSIALDTKANAYRVDATQFTSLYTLEDGSATPFFKSSEVIVTDEVIDAVATDGSAFYAALTIDNQCNVNVEGTRVSINSYSGAVPGGVSYSRDVDFTQSLEEITVFNSTLYGFYFSVEDPSNLSVVSKSATENFEEWVDTTFDPNTEFFDVSNYMAYGDKVIIQIDEGCKHYLLEYDLASGTYTNQVETFWTVDEFVTDPTSGLIFYTVQYDGASTATASGQLRVVNGTETTVIKRYNALLGKMHLYKPGVVILNQFIEGTDGTEYIFEYIDYFNSANSRTSSEQLFSVEVDSSPGTVVSKGIWSGVTSNPDTQKLLWFNGYIHELDIEAWLASADDSVAPVIRASIHFGVLANDNRFSPDDPLSFFVVNNVKGTDSTPAKDLIYTGGNYYDLDSDGILMDDFGDLNHILVTWTGSAIYSTEYNSSASVSKWTFSPNLELVGSSDQMGTNLGLVTANVNGTPTAILITKQADGKISFISNLDEDAVEITNNLPAEEQSEEAGTEEEGAAGGGNGVGNNLQQGNCGVYGCVEPHAGGTGISILLSLVVLVGLRQRKVISIS